MFQERDAMGDKYLLNQTNSGEVDTEGFEGSRQFEVLDICTKKVMRQVGETSAESEKYYHKMMEKVLRRMTYKDLTVAIVLDDVDSRNRKLKLTPSLSLRTKRFGETI
jgi:hypothetical protein